MTSTVQSPGKSRPSKAKSPDMKEVILDAAIKVFASVGYEGTSFRQITELCGAKRSLILYHYSSKEELWERAGAKVKEAFMAKLDEQLSLAQPTTDEQRLHLLFCAFMRASREVPEYGWLILREGLSSSQRLEWISQQLVPLSVSAANFESQVYYEAAFTGMTRHVLAGAILYVSNMGPLMMLDENAGEGLNPLSEESIQQVADIAVGLVAQRLKV